MTRPVVVTGIGLVSSLGEGIETHLAALAGPPRPRIDAERFAPYPVHPMPAIEWDRQIAKKADQRQMEPWQRLGVYTAGLALEAAGLKDEAEAKSRMQMIVAAGGGERDYAVDGQILTGLRNAADPGAFLNERLMSDLRPTLFLAQLSNLLAGNIAIVHGVTGASRTFMGEEMCGVDALRIAQARIASGQVDAMLVGSSYNAERWDSLLIFELGGYLWTRPFAPVWDRPAEGGGLILGSAAAFLVLEARDQAERRGAAIQAELLPVQAARTRRGPGAVPASLRQLWTGAAVPEGATVLSGATGVAGVTEEEREALAQLAPGVPLHATGDLLGHPLEAVAPVGAAIAAALVASRRASDAVATTVGHRRGEGLVRFARAQ
ncbi:beta-ketoacyl-ACP synthase [Enterovirga aerilata]|uniref:Beta-ketoacyl-ACP synthase n=1 Tax=Enterovirga aerilata TaxID=2730920 RepID=A0A849I761_9HYPH|nr:beta-ketoacyl-ACP synthase [Enterovirga sp. DB1703]